jgi:hypothetical protein
MRERRHTFRVLTRDLLSRPPSIETIDVMLHQKDNKGERKETEYRVDCKNKKLKKFQQSFTILVLLFCYSALISNSWMIYLKKNNTWKASISPVPSQVSRSRGCKVSIYLSNSSIIGHHPYLVKVERSQKGQFTVNHARFYPYIVECVFGLSYYCTRAHSDLQGPRTPI